MLGDEGARQGAQTKLQLLLFSRRQERVLPPRPWFEVTATTLGGWDELWSPLTSPWDRDGEVAQKLRELDSTTRKSGGQPSVGAHARAQNTTTAHVVKESVTSVVKSSATVIADAGDDDDDDDEIDMDLMGEVSL